jgi:hypothetical protein
MFATMSFALLTGIVPAGSFDSFSNAQLYIRRVNIDSNWDPAAHGFAGMLTYSPEAFRVEY